MIDPGPEPPLPEPILAAVEDICRRNGISSMGDFIAACRAFAHEGTLSVAVLGRFKAGKSSFLNRLLGRPLLPVGVIPVTTAITEIQWGPRERAEILFRDGHTDGPPLSRIAGYLSESSNPGNALGVTRVRIELPEMERFRGIRFVDTPGLESVLDHSTAASLEWLPNVGLALVAVAVDPPLSRHDVELIRTLGRYTTKIALLLTKADAVADDERIQVRRFVEAQLGGSLGHALPVFPFSVRPGFEPLCEALEEHLLSRANGDAASSRAEILRHKLRSLLDECAGYLRVALKVAEAADSDRDRLEGRILGERAALDDTRLSMKLIVRHAASAARTEFEALLRAEEMPSGRRLHDGLEHAFPSWTRSLGVAVEGFEQWMRGELTREMSTLSLKHHDAFLAPVRRTARRLSQALQDFRGRLSGRALEVIGVPLDAAPVELHVVEPTSPDVRVGLIFDRNWELLSWLIPMALIRGTVRNHYHRRIENLVPTNLSRLASQWAEAVTASLAALETESLRRLDNLIDTVSRLLAAAPESPPAIRHDCELLDALRRSLGA